MDAEMVAIFPKGIRALLVDNDTKFVKSATMLLSILNFDVVACSSVTHALKSLTSGDLKGFDVILAHAAKAAACGFDFRAIIETDLLIPVVYFLPQDHQATGDEADELLSTLQEGTYIMKKPLDINEVRTRLWNVIAWHKCHLETKASGGGTSGKRTADEAGLDAEGKDEGRVHYKVVRARRGRKRKSSSKSGSSSAVTGGHPVAKAKETDNEARQLQPAQQKQGRGKEAQKNDGGEVFKLQQPSKAMINDQQPDQHHPKPTLLAQSIPRTPNVTPTYDPKFFTSATVPSYDPKFLFFYDAAGPSSNAGTSSAAAPPAICHMYSSTPSALPPPVPQQQQPSVHSAVFGNIMSPTAVTTTMAATTNAAYEPPQFSPNIGNQQQQDIPSLLAFGPFPLKGPPPPPLVQQYMFTPAATGGLFTGGMDGGGSMSGGSSATAATEAGACSNEVTLSFLEAPILGAEQNGGGGRAGMADPPVALAPQNIGDASNKVGMLEALFSDDYGDCSGGSSFTALDQVLGMVSNVNELTTMNTFGEINAAPHVLNTTPNGGNSSNNASIMPSNVSDLTSTGGAFADRSFASSMVPQDQSAVSNGGSNNAALFMAHQGLGAAPIGGGNNDVLFMVPHQDLGVAPNGGGSNATPFMVPHQDLSVASNGDQLVLESNIMGSQGHGSAAIMQGDNVGIAASILPSDQYEDNTSFPLEALLGDPNGPIFEFDDFDIDALVSGSISGGATATDAAGTSFASGGGGGGDMDDSAISSLDGLEIPEGLFTVYRNNIFE